MDKLVQSWLTLQCQQLSEVAQALVCQGTAEQIEVLARWPDAQAAAGLEPFAARVIEQRQPVEQLEAEGYLLALPLPSSAPPAGVVVVRLSGRAAPARRAAQRILQWGLGWLDLMLTQRRDTALSHDPAMFSLLARALQKPSLKSMAGCLVTELAARFACTRVSLGLQQRGRCRVLALSNKADFDARTQLLEQLRQAMAEVAAGRQTVILPGASAADQLTLQSRQYARQQAVPWLAVFPLLQDDTAVGALVLERRQPLLPWQLALCTTLAALLGALLRARAEAEVAWTVRVGRGFAGLWLKLFGRGFWRAKLVSASLLLLAAVLSLVDTEYRIAAEARIEGETRQLVVAPQEGFIATAPVRAGDAVDQGALLATLDDRDLRLEQLRWVSQREQHLQEYNAALAEYDRARLNILKAQIQQAEAQIALLDGRLARTRLEAPIAGYIVQGDLTQALGAPVTQGQILFEISPLDNYRVVLQVAEQSVAAVARGQTGQLRLSGLPGQSLAFRVAAVQPVLHTAGGQSYYRVEARLLTAAEQLRPGMTGIGKIRVGSRKLGWAWFHEVLHHLRFWTWVWWR